MESGGFKSLRLTSVDIVTQKEIVGLRREPSKLENSEEVIITTVNVSTYFDRGFDFDERGLGHEHFPERNPIMRDHSISLTVGG